MKTIVNILFCGLFCLCSYSCKESNEECLVDSEEPQSNLITSTISYNEMVSFHQNLFEYINSPITRGYGEESEENAKEIMQPLVADGEQIIEQIIEAIDTENLEVSQEDIELLENFSEEQLAALSFMVYNIDENNPTYGYIVNSDGEINPEILDQPYTMSQIMECLAEAFGINIVKDVYNYIKGTKMLMTATNALKIAKALGIRTLGWASIAYSTYEFAICLKNSGYQVSVH